MSARFGRLVAGLALLASGWAAEPSADGAAPAEAAVPAARIAILDLSAAPLAEAMRTMSAATGVNLAATPEAAKRVIDLRLSDVTLDLAVRTICLTNGLWYRYDADARLIRLMTVDEYRRGLSSFRDDTTRVVTLLYPKARLIGEQLAHLFGERVELQSGEAQDLSNPDQRSGEGSGQSGGGGSGESNADGNGQSSRGGGRTTGSQGAARTQPSTQQLAEAGTGDATAAEEVRRRAFGDLPPIYLFVNITDNVLTLRSRDTAALDEMERLARDLDRPTPQVLLQIRILSIALGDDFRSAFDLQGAGDTAVSPGPVQSGANPFAAAGAGGLRSTGGLGNFPADGGTFVYQFLTSNLRARIQLLAGENRVTTVSSPLVMGAHARRTDLFVGEERLLVTGFVNTTQTSNGVTTGGIVATTEQRSVGTQLALVPSINADRAVDLALSQEVATIKPGGQVVAVIDSQGTVQSLPIDTIELSRIVGSVVVPDGQTVAIGGLIRESTSDVRSKVPFLGDIPLIGIFFRRQLTQKQRTELIILITPFVISVPGEGAPLVRSRLERLSLNPDLFDEAPSRLYREKDVGSGWEELPLGTPRPRPTPSAAAKP